MEYILAILGGWIFNWCVFITTDTYRENHKEGAVAAILKLALIIPWSYAIGASVVLVGVLLAFSILIPLCIIEQVYTFIKREAKRPPK